jgi:SAM-dependent methyltransferase
MSEAARHDAWQAGDSYDAFMGRWSRKVARPFLDWLDAGPGLDWLDVGCGTGALSEAILAQSYAASLIALDPSQGFVERARKSLGDGRAEVRLGNAQDLDLPAGSRDVVVSGLVLNFVADRPRALAEMMRVLRPGGRLGFYVWDYPGGGVQFLRAFWTAAAALDDQAADLSEGRRFPFCIPDELRALAEAAGFSDVSLTAIEVPTDFADFEDFWRPFTLGAGPAPGYCSSLAPDARDRLRENLHASLPRTPDGGIAMTARALAVQAVAPPAR